MHDHVALRHHPRRCEPVRFRDFHTGERATFPNLTSAYSHATVFGSPDWEIREHDGTLLDCASTDGAAASAADALAHRRHVA